MGRKSVGTCTWGGLNRKLADAGEKECLEMLRDEVRGLNRAYYKNRIYNRYSRMRRGRERLELKFGKQK